MRCRAVLSVPFRRPSQRSQRWLSSLPPAPQRGPLVGRQLSRDKRGRLQTTFYYVNQELKSGFLSDEPERGRKRSLKDTTEELAQRAVRALLPRDYPDSVRQGYKSYILYQMGASLAGSANGVLSTQALLYAMGLGAGSIPLAAALNWVLKDGIGQVGGIVFASVVNDKFDANPKRWKMVSALSLDAACLLELLAPLAPNYFLAIASLANVGKNVCYLSSSASRAAIHNSFAIRENLADITAKSGSQSIVTGIVGTSMGIALSSSLGSSWTALLPVFASLSFVHLTCNYLSLGHVSLNTINMERLNLILQEFDTSGRVPPPTDVSSKERFFLSSSSEDDPTLPPSHVARPLPLSVKDAAQLSSLAAMYQEDCYLLNARGWSRSGRAEVDLLVKEEADMDDVIRGFFHAHMLRKDMVAAGWKGSPTTSNAGSNDDEEVWLEDLLRSSYRKLYDPMLTAKAAAASPDTPIEPPPSPHHPHHHHEKKPVVDPLPGECLADFFLRQLEAAGWLVDNVFLPHAENRIVLETGAARGGLTQ